MERSAEGSRAVERSNGGAAVGKWKGVVKAEGCREGSRKVEKEKEVGERKWGREMERRSEGEREKK